MMPSVAIVGGGPAALLLAASLDTKRFEVTIYEKNKALGRKFLVAGKGGFNLTHSEPIDSFATRYTPSSFLQNALLDFDNEALRQWLEELGIPTFVGSSKRIYPVTGTKPITVLKTILERLAAKNVRILTQHQWTGWDENDALIFNNKQLIQADYIVFALGGGSWKVTGSDGTWLDIFAKKGIPTKPFVAANCAYQIHWERTFLQQNAGKPLKNIAIRCAKQQQKGEVVITDFGLEGNAIYALSPSIQTQLSQQGTANIFVDLKPTVTQETLYKRLVASKEKNISSALRQTLKLNATKVALLKATLSKNEFLSPPLLCKSIKKLPLIIQKAAPIDEAISTTGGIDLTAVNPFFELKTKPNTFCIGEMLDWNAPTGGYLLQACFSMGVYLARHLNGGNRF